MRTARFLERREKREEREVRNENRPRPAAALAEYRLLRISRAGLKWRIAAPPFPILPAIPDSAPPFPILPRHSRFCPAIPDFCPAIPDFCPAIPNFCPLIPDSPPSFPRKRESTGACPRENGGIADAVGTPASAAARLCQNQDSPDGRDFQDFISPGSRFSP